MASTLGYGEGDDEADQLYSNAVNDAVAASVPSAAPRAAALAPKHDVRVQPPKHADREPPPPQQQHQQHQQQEQRQQQHQQQQQQQHHQQQYRAAPPAPRNNGPSANFQNPEAHPEFNTSNQTTGFVAATRAGFKYSVDKDEFNPCKVFVGNLLWTTTVADMQNYFAQFGGIEDCKIMTDKYTNQSRGFGFVAFREEECT